MPKFLITGDSGSGKSALAETDEIDIAAFADAQADPHIYLRAKRACPIAFCVGR